MKIDKIEIKRIKNLGNYESLTLSIAAIPTPHLPLSGEFDKLTKFIDYKLNETERTAKYEKYKADLETGDLTDAEKKKAEAYVKRYVEFKAEIEALELEFVQNEPEV